VNSAPFRNSPWTNTAAVFIALMYGAA
jgi:hypothetical protein